MKKITELQPIVGLVNTDILPVVDISETDNTLSNKKITVQQILDLIVPVFTGYISPENVIEVAIANRSFTDLNLASIEAKNKVNSTGYPQLIIVYPGVYNLTESLILNRDVNYYFLEGAIVDSSDILHTSNTAHMLFTDIGVSQSNTQILGKGIFTAHAAFYQTNVIRLVNPGSNIYFEADSLGSENYVDVIFIQNGNLKIKCNTIISQIPFGS